MVKDYDTSVLYHPGKANVVANALSRLSMGCVSHVDEAKKDLLKYVHRLDRFAVRLEDYMKRCFMVHHNSESSFVVEVKSKKHLDQAFMELKESFLGKLNVSFSLWGMVC